MFRIKKKPVISGSFSRSVPGTLGSAYLGVLADECFDVGEMRVLADLVGFIGDEQAAGVQSDLGIRDAAE